MISIYKMLRRRKKKNNMTTYIASIFSIWIVAILFFTWVLKIDTHNSAKSNSISNHSSTTWDTQTKNKQYYADTIVSETWTMIKTKYNINWWYSHKINTLKDIFYVKSDKYNLNDFLDKKVFFSWEVIWFSNDNIPVLNITSINTGNILKEDDNTQKEEKKDKNKYLSTKWLVVDLEWTNFQVNKTDWNIYIYQSWTWIDLSWKVFTWWDTKFIKIEPYKCIKWSNLYDCEAFKNQSKIYKFNTTTNDNWVVFYKMPEVSQYVVINKDYGYNIYPLTWDFFKFIKYINIEDLQSKKQQLIKNTCKNNKIQLTQLLTMQNSWDKYNVIWFDKDANKVLCKFTISWENQMIWQLQSISYITQTTSSNVKIWDLNEKDYLIYNSKGYGYKLYMPKSIKYTSELVHKDFWVSWLDCKQVTKIADWKTWDLKNPNVKAYYCKTDLSKEQIQWFLKNNTIKQNNWKTLILDMKEDSLSKKIASDIHIF